MGTRKRRLPGRRVLRRVRGLLSQLVPGLVFAVVALVTLAWAVMLLGYLSQLAFGAEQSLRFSFLDGAFQDLELELIALVLIGLYILGLLLSRQTRRSVGSSGSRQLMRRIGRPLGK